MLQCSIIDAKVLEKKYLQKTGHYLRLRFTVSTQTARGNDDVLSPQNLILLPIRGPLRVRQQSVMACVTDGTYARWQLGLHIFLPNQI